MTKPAITSLNQYGEIKMIFREYIELKYGDKIKVLTCSDCKALGVRWPQAKGWLERLGDYNISDNYADAALKSRSQSRKAISSCPEFPDN